MIKDCMQYFRIDGRMLEDILEIVEKSDEFDHKSEFLRKAVEDAVKKWRKKNNEKEDTK